MRASSVQIVSVFAVGLVVRLLFLQTPQAPLANSADALAYLRAAQHLLAGSMAPPDWAHMASRGPGYISFLVGVMAIFGEDLQWIRYAQAGAGALTAAVLYAVGCAVGNRSIGLVAGLATALWPSLVLHTGLLHTETLATLLLWSAIALLVRGAAGRAGLMVSAGVFGLACLTRPTLLPMLPLLVAAVCVAPAAGTHRRRAVLAVAFAGVVLLPLVSWNATIRALGHVPVAGSVGVEIFLSNIALSTDPPDRGWSQDPPEVSLPSPPPGMASRLAAAGNAVFMHVWYSDNIWRQGFVLSPSGMNAVQRAGLLFGLAGIGLALLRGRQWAPILAAVIFLAVGSLKWRIEPRPQLPLVPALLLLAGLFVHGLVVALRRDRRRAIGLLSSATLACGVAAWLAQGPPSTGAVFGFLEPAALSGLGVAAVVAASIVTSVLLFRLWRPELGTARAAVVAFAPGCLFAPLFLCYAVAGSDPRSRKFELDLGTLAQPLSVEIRFHQEIPAAQIKSAAVLLDLESPTHPPRVELAVNGRPVPRDLAVWHLLSCRPTPAVDGHSFGALEKEGEGATMCGVYEAFSRFQGRPMASWPQWWLVHIDEALVADRSAVTLSFDSSRWRDQEKVRLGGVFTTPGSTTFVGPAVSPRRMSIYRFEILDDWRLWDETRLSSARRTASLGPSRAPSRYLADRLEDGSAQVGVRLVARLRDGRILFY